MSSSNCFRQVIPDKSVQSSLLQLLSHVRLFVTPWTAAPQASLSITNSWSLLKLRSIELVMPSNHLRGTTSVVPFSSCLQSFAASKSFPGCQFFASGGQSIGVSASASVLPMNIHSTPGWVTKILQAVQHGQKQKGLQKCIIQMVHTSLFGSWCK